MKGVFVNDLLWDDVNVEFHVFGFWEVIIEIEVFDVGDETFWSWSEDDTAEDKFGGGDYGSGSTQQPR